MKIVELRHHLVRVPFVGALREVVARDWNDMSLISELVTDEGLVGIAEMSQIEEIEEAQSQIRWAEANLLGIDPLSCDLHGVVQPWHLGLFDLVGKALGLPAWRLMGDKVRDRVTVSYWSLGQLGVAGTIREAELAAERGFRVHKLKARSDTVIAIARGVQEAVGDRIALGIDPNTGFGSYHDTLQLVRQLEPYHIADLEDPFPLWGNAEQYRLLRRKTDIPVGIHYACGSPAQVLDIAGAGVCDFVVLHAGDNSGRGSTTASLLAKARIAEAAGLRFWISTNPLGHGFGAAMMLHQYAVCPGATMSADILHYLRESSLTTDPLAPVNGELGVPEGPGLGVELDGEALARYALDELEVKG